MQVARRPGRGHRPLGHEGGGPPELPGDLLHPGLEDEVTVGHVKGLAVGDVDLVLASSGFALGELDRDPGLHHLAADTADHVLLAGGLQELVVLDGVGVGHQPLPCLAAASANESRNR